MGILLVLKTFPSFATLLVVDEKPTQAHRDTGATHNYKLIFCWTMEAITNYFYGNNGHGGLYESWSATGVSSLSTMVVLLRLASASRKQIRDHGRRCRGRGFVY